MNTPIITNDNSPAGSTSLVDIYQNYQTSFIRYADKIMNEGFFAEDIVQDVFITLLQQTNYFVSEGVALKYIYKAIYNRCIDLIRRKQIVLHYEESCIEEARTDLYKEEVDDILTKEFTMIVEKKIKNLPPKCKQIFVMKYKSEYSNPEISAKLGLSIRTVENQMYIARNALRRQVDNYLRSV